MPILESCFFGMIFGGGLASVKIFADKIVEQCWVENSGETIRQRPPARTRAELIAHHRAVCERQRQRPRQPSRTEPPRPVPEPEAEPDC